MDTKQNVIAANPLARLANQVNDSANFGLNEGAEAPNGIRYDYARSSREQNRSVGCGLYPLQPGRSSSGCRADPTLRSGFTIPDLLRVRVNNLGFLPVITDGQALAFKDGCFDVVICHLGLQFFPDPARGLAEFCRVLRPGGRASV